MPAETPTQIQELLTLLRTIHSVMQYVRCSPFLKLLACMMVDTIGFASFLLPGLGEMADIGWAPLHGYFLFFMFGL